MFAEIQCSMADSRELSIGVRSFVTTACLWTVPNLYPVQISSNVVRKSRGLGCQPFTSQLLFPPARLVVLAIELPSRTKFVPLEFCTIQNEEEIVIVSQGTLSVFNTSEHRFDHWNPIINFLGARTPTRATRFRNLRGRKKRN
jgi:hypothetical protein